MEGYGEENGILNVPQGYVNTQGVHLHQLVGEQWGFIEKTNRFIITPQYDGALEFSEGMAAVKLGKLWGYIDRTVELVIRPQFEAANLFRMRRLSPPMGSSATSTKRAEPLFLRVWIRVRNL